MLINSFGAHVLERLAPPALRERYLPGLLSGERFVSLTSTYSARLRALARVAPTQAHRYALVDMANTVRPMSTF